MICLSHRAMDDDAEDGDSLPAIGVVAATSIALIAAIIRRE